MGDDKNTFQLLNRAEIQKTLLELSSYKGDILLWAKGTSSKETFRIFEFVPETLTLSLSSILKSSSLINKDVLISFESQNLQFFSTGTLTIDNAKDYFLTVSDKTYKSDKRKDFRINSEDLSFYTISIGEIKFPGFDLSAGGASFIVDEQESIALKKQTDLQNISLSFNETTFKIPEVEIRYIKSHNNYKNNKNLFKVGLKFSSINEKFEALIFREINTAIYKKLKPSDS